MRPGVFHWWAQRVTAVLLVPLALWFVYALATLPLADHAVVSGWIASGWHPLALGLLVVTLAWHSQLGIQVVLEDYVHARRLQSLALLASTLAHLALAVAALVAIGCIVSGSGA